MQQRRCVIVAGFPRSGTSWLAKSLSFARGFTYYREPDNVDMVPEAEDRFRTLYLTADHDDPAYRSLMTRALTGRLATRFTMREDPGPLIAALGGGRGLRVAQRFPVLFFRKQHVLVKLVNANLNLAWFTAHFPRARQVFLLRHPCGQFESWRRLGWEPDPRSLLENPRLVADHLAPFADLMARADTFWERAGALWAATVHVVHRQTAGKARVIVAYEWLCADPLSRFADLYRRLDMTWTRGAERFIRASDTETDPGTYSMRRPTARQIDKWRSRLDPEDVDACRRFVEPFGLPYYPGFEPHVGSFAGDRAE